MTTKPVNIAETFAALEAARRNRQPEPYLVHWLASSFMALSVIIMNYSTLVPVVPILVFFAMWLPLIVIKQRTVAMISLDGLLVMSVPLLCAVSALWSAYPRISLYLGVAFVALMVCIVVMARAVSFRAFVTGCMAGAVITLVTTLMSDRYSVDAETGVRALVGHLGSKNVVGFVAQIGTLMSVFYYFNTHGIFRRIGIAIPMLVVSLYCLYISHSSTALVSVIAASAMMLAGLLIAQFPRHLRRTVLLISLIGMGTCIAAISFTGGRETMLATLGKDATLTGRTYLWQEGMKIGQQRPLLGLGYSAFWVQGQPQAERYWHEFRISGRTGFHFHSTYIETFVELGVLGLTLIATLIFGNCWLAMRMILQRGAEPEALLLLGLSIMFLVRSFVEIDFFSGPFSVGALLFYGIIPRLAGLRKVAA